MPGLGALFAIGLLVVGTVVLCVTLALAARALDRVWDAVARDDDRRNEAGSRPARTAVGGRARTTVPRQVLVAMLAAALISALTWLAFTLQRARGLG